MLRCLVVSVLTPLFSLVQSAGSVHAINVSSITVGPPTAVTELDLGKLKGEPRQLSWSADGTQFYVQTAEGNPGKEKLRHYIISAAGSVPAGQDTPPQWATDYWLLKAGRSAPGLDSLTIDAKQSLEMVASGPGVAGALDREGTPLGGGSVSGEAIAKGTEPNQKSNVWRLTLLGETVSEFVNQNPVPGLMFGWGPESSGVIAYTDRQFGRLMLLDQDKHKLVVAGVKEALLPAWSMDGARLAWVQKSGRKKYTLFWAAVSAKG